LCLGPDQAERGWAEQQAADQLSHDRWLTDPLCGFAHGATDDEQKRDVGEKYYLRATRVS
jgi:hypothetical protein